jgi:diaminopimelate decarboxylase
LSNVERLALFPRTTTLIGEGAETRLAIGSCDLATLVEQYGTPLYLYDQTTLDGAADEYRQALARHYPGAWGVTYAGKAFLSLAAAQWATRQGFWLDCTGAGELYIATAAGVAARSILVHGVNKSYEDLIAAVTHAGTIVVDNLVELERLAAILDKPTGPRPELWLRVKPGVAVDTHAYRQTGQEESKFGLSPAETVEAVSQCQRGGLPLTGLHFHQGSHFHDPSPIGPALETVLDLMVELHSNTGWSPATLCVGGGWGVAYHEDDLPHPTIEAYVAFVAQQLAAGVQRRGLPLPRLQVEPGRSLVARAGVAIYRIGAVKETANRRWVMIDGGMADNPRPALYGARYSALPVAQPLRETIGPAWLAGPYCESGDVLIEALPLPPLEAGELIAVPVSGAYHLMMGSNYNGARKPAVVWVQGGQASLIQRRERVEDLVARDQGLPDFSSSSA